MRGTLGSSTELHRWLVEEEIFPYPASPAALLCGFPCGLSGVLSTWSLFRPEPEECKPATASSSPALLEVSTSTWLGSPWSGKLHVTKLWLPLGQVLRMGMTTKPIVFHSQYTQEPKKTRMHSIALGIKHCPDVTSCNTLVTICNFQTQLANLF